MKGILFTELLEMVEGRFGFDVADHIVVENTFPHFGVYTAVGDYPYAEIECLLISLESATKVPMDQLLYDYGKHLFTVFKKSRIDWLKECTSSVSLIKKVLLHFQEVSRWTAEYQDFPEILLELDEVGQIVFRLKGDYIQSIPEVMRGFVDEVVYYYQETLTLEIAQRVADSSISFSLYNKSCVL
ncbi:heme NO-binding domain-containing protein [Algivirga pacifica]|uniref:Heme NO-binding domain-containing protein n=1 Tax=Algivirga pacifica TaxID=1162670 RepID=A0ABP9D9D9_9BACT